MQESLLFNTALKVIFSGGQENKKKGINEDVIVTADWFTRVIWNVFRENNVAKREAVLLAIVL